MKAALVNTSTLVPANEWKEGSAGVAAQVKEDVAPAWNRLTPEWQLFPDLASVPAGQNWDPIVLLDTPDQANALGYHLTLSDGTPCGRVFVAASLADGKTWTEVFSHEWIELMINRDCNRWAQAPGGRLWCLEPGDPVQGSSYQKGGVVVSNFARQPFFDWQPQAGAKFDHMGVLDGPFRLAPNSYGIIMAGDTISQVHADGRTLGWTDLPEHKRQPGGRWARIWGAHLWPVT